MNTLRTKTNALNKLLICCVLSLITVSLNAQKRFEVFTVAGNVNFMQPTAINPNNSVETALLAALNFPVVFKDSSVWITMVDYAHYSINNEYFLTDANPIKQFNLDGFIVRTGYIHRFNATQALHALFIPRYMTDFKATFSNCIQLGGMLAYEKIKSKNLTWRAGVLFNQEFFGPYLIPILYLDWNITSKLKFTGLLPIYGKLFIQPAANLTTGLHFIGLTTSYRINENSYTNYYVERNSIDLSYFVNTQLAKNIFIEGRVGYSLTKDYALYAENQKVAFAIPLHYFGDNRIRSNNTYNGSPFIHLKLFYSIAL